MGEWQSVKLGDVADLKGGYAFKSSQYTPDGHFVLRTVNIDENYSITKEGANFISLADAKNFERFQLQPNDTLFVMVAATLGKIGLVRERDLPALLNQNMWVIRSKGLKIDQLFLHYLFREVSKVALGWVSGSARSFLKRDDVRNLEFLLPPPIEQKTIANVLSALDDKIELNRRTNETLEAMAQAIFKDWFVDFGPVRRKQAGETDPTAILGGLIPPSEKATQTAALFPDTFGDDGLPEGWSERPLTKIAQVKQGSYLAKSEIESQQTDAYSIPVHGANGIRGWTKTAKFRQGVALLTCRGSNCGLVLWADGPLWVSNNAMSITRKDGSDFFCYYLVANDPPYNVVSGSAQPQITATALSSRFYVAPKDEIIRAFEGTVAPLKKGMLCNLRQNKTLAETRDYLLPKLMSGQICAGDAESMVA